ncbi:hypothetical protein SAMN05443999_112111 [Roseovarius azorensis]|uniref:Uncharacterized protein n=1 Tax=Roseovarius azorensis TaxID=1287727 RepID=A0A1H7VK66_9RHOB|nr:hypothetical protein [Roseovarius azorensis]SEM09265.1 hypothetical protein SAMN05443999_112111 [Roseovarius azorensis]
MTRGHVGLLLALGMLGLMALDFTQSRSLNPYTAPPMLALGSGLAATGGHCAAPPPK